MPRRVIVALVATGGFFLIMYLVRVFRFPKTACWDCGGTGRIYPMLGSHKNFRDCTRCGASGKQIRPMRRFLDDLLDRPDQR